MLRAEDYRDRTYAGFRTAEEWKEEGRQEGELRAATRPVAGAARPVREGIQGPRAHREQDGRFGVAGDLARAGSDRQPRGRSRDCGSGPAETRPAAPPAHPRGRAARTRDLLQARNPGNVARRPIPGAMGSYPAARQGNLRSRTADELAGAGFHVSLSKCD